MIPSFPLRFEYKGLTLRAIFRQIPGEPKKAVVVVKDVLSQTLAKRTFNPTVRTSESWIQHAKEAFDHADPQHLKKVLGSKAPPTDPHATKNADKNRLLPGVRGNKLPIVRAKDLEPLEAYRTAHPAHPENRFFSRLVQKLPSGQVRVGILFRSKYDPGNTEWKELDLPPDYPFTVYQGEDLNNLTKKFKPSASTSGGHENAEQGGRTMSKQTSSAKTGGKSIGKLSGGSVFEAWGQAFAKHGNSNSAPKLIVERMEREFPDKDTQWAKWVNNIRALYNRGDKRLGVKAPKEAIPVYKDVRIGKDRRTKPSKNGKKREPELVS